MIIELKIPSPGESISEVEIASWLAADGDFVEKDQELAELESDKATLPLIAPDSGKLKFLIKAGETVRVGAVAGTIDTGVSGKTSKKNKPIASIKSEIANKQESITGDEVKEEPENNISEVSVQTKTDDDSPVKITPLAKKMMEENKLSLDDIIKGLKKITTKEVSRVLTAKSDQKATPVLLKRTSQRAKISQLRKKLSQRLVAVKNETAMLTTFNEVDMSEIIGLRKKYQQQFQEKYNIKLGFMSFFAKAVTEALTIFPKVNSMLDGDDIVTSEFVDICIAVQTDKGLMVPVIRNTESLTLPQIELKIAELAEKAKSFKISVEEMSGGTFTITNGGVFGSMLSTPILNPPQSAILGMHNIVERPVVINGKIDIRPMMYLALSYDHRVIDGRDSVSFLVKVKELIEKPSKMLLLNSGFEKLLLGLD